MRTVTWRMVARTALAFLFWAIWLPLLYLSALTLAAIPLSLLDSAKAQVVGFVLAGALAIAVALVMGWAGGLLGLRLRILDRVLWWAPLGLVAAWWTSGALLRDLSHGGLQSIRTGMASVLVFAPVFVGVARAMRERRAVQTPPD